jgi:hypothetical protein
MKEGSIRLDQMVLICEAKIGRKIFLKVIQLPQLKKNAMFIYYGIGKILIWEGTVKTT